MEPLRIHTGIVCPLNRSNVDTDQIIPKQFLKELSEAALDNFYFITGALMMMVTCERIFQ